MMSIHSVAVPGGCAFERNLVVCVYFVRLSGLFVS